jgi:hypothetical protein
MSSELIANMPPEAVAGFSNDTLAAAHGGCAGFTFSQFYEIPLEAFSGFTEDCVAKLDPWIFANITYDQMMYPFFFFFFEYVLFAQFIKSPLMHFQRLFPQMVYPGFTAEQLNYLPDGALSAIPIPYLNLFSADQIQGFTAHQFEVFIKQHQAVFINLWSVAQLQSI